MQFCVAGHCVGSRRLRPAARMPPPRLRDLACVRDAGAGPGLSPAPPCGICEHASQRSHPSVIDARFGQTCSASAQARAFFFQSSQSRKMGLGEKNARLDAKMCAWTGPWWSSFSRVLGGCMRVWCTPWARCMSACVLGRELCAPGHDICQIACVDAQIVRLDANVCAWTQYMSVCAG